MGLFANGFVGSNFVGKEFWGDKKAMNGASAQTFTPLMAFIWGAAGSIAIEIISLLAAIRRDGGMSGVPGYYKQPVFWFVRLLVMGIAGGMAVAETASNPLNAATIGASVPAILALLVGLTKTPFETPNYPASGPAGGPGAPAAIIYPVTDSQPETMTD